ncbi:MAG: DUF202 domain-containing protein [Nocardioides sp.]
MPSADPSGEPDYRFTLANERTYLAYERTAVGLAGASLAVFHLLDAGWPDRVLSALLLLAATVAAAGGYLRFRLVERAIRAGAALPANRVAHLLAGSLVLCLLAVALSVLV